MSSVAPAPRCAPAPPRPPSVPPQPPVSRFRPAVARTYANVPRRLTTAMATTIANAHSGSPTRPRPAPELRGSPAAAAVGLGEAATTSAGMPRPTNQPSAVANATFRAPGTRAPLCGRIGNRPHDADRDGREPTREEAGDRTRHALAPL